MSAPRIILASLLSNLCVKNYQNWWKFDDLTKLWQKQFCTVFLRHGVVRLAEDRNVCWRSVHGVDYTRQTSSIGCQLKMFWRNLTFIADTCHSYVTVDASHFFYTVNRKKHIKMFLIYSL